MAWSVLALGACTPPPNERPPTAPPPLGRPETAPPRPPGAVAGAEPTKHRRCRRGSKPSGVRCYGDAGLVEAVEVGLLQRRRAADQGTLRVRIPLHNLSPAEVRFGVQLDFVDSAGRCYGDRTTRRVLTLKPDGVEWLTATSRKQRAHDIVVHLSSDDSTESPNPSPPDSR